MPSQTATVQVYRDGSTCFIPVPFDPRSVFGKMRAPLRVTLNGYTYRTTVVTMDGVCCVPLRRSNREAAKLSGGETLEVTFELDPEKREVSMPPELASELSTSATLASAWRGLSFTRQREYAESIDGARKRVTKAQRVAKIIQALAAIAAKGT